MYLDPQHCTAHTVTYEHTSFIHSCGVWCVCVNEVLPNELPYQDKCILHAYCLYCMPIAYCLLSLKPLLSDSGKFHYFAQKLNKLFFFAEKVDSGTAINFARK